MKLRTAARALIVQNEKVLFSKCKDSQGIFYVLPGGKIETHELAKEALHRECLEETGYTIEVQELVMVKEFIKKIPDIPAFKDGLHQIELVFKCSIDENKPKEAAKAMDIYQIDLEWIDIAKIKDLRVYPTKNLAQYAKENHKLSRYLGIREDD